MEAIRFFEISPEQWCLTQGTRDAWFSLCPNLHSRAVLRPDSPEVPLDILENCVQIYPRGRVTDDTEFVWIAVKLSQEKIAAIMEYLDSPDPMSIEAVQEMDIETKYLGESYERDPEITDPDQDYGWIFRTRPALQGQEQVATDEESGEPIFADIVKRVSIQ